MRMTRLARVSTAFLTMSLIGLGAGLGTQATPAASVREDLKKDEDDKNEDAARERSKNNLKQIMLAILNYADTNNGRLPTSAIYDKDGKALLSWRVLVLPYVEQNDLFKEFVLDEPWDSEHNKTLLAKMPKVYAPPRGEHKENSTVYQVFTGKDTVFDGMQAMRFPASITDGTSNTIAVVEAKEAVAWTKPADLVFESDKALPKLGGMFKDVFHAAFFDGSVSAFKKDFDEMTMKAAITPRGGEVYDPNKIKADK